jgi:hypothetical protein
MHLDIFNVTIFRVQKKTLLQRVFIIFIFDKGYMCIYNYNMTSFKRFEAKSLVKIILIYDRLRLEQPFYKHRPHLSMTQSVIYQYYFYQGFGLKAFEGRHIIIIDTHVSFVKYKYKTDRYYKLVSLAKIQNNI